MQWTTSDRSQKFNIVRPRQCPPNFCQDALGQFLDTPSNQCQVDVHTHFGQLQTALAACTRYEETWMGSHPQKPQMSAQTWEFVCAKRKWRASLARCQRLHSRPRMHLFFAAWRHNTHNMPFLNSAQAFDTILHQLDQDVAIALHHFRRLGKLVTQASRQDDAMFYQNLAKESANCIGPSDARQFWKVLRRSWPKFRQRRQGFDPLAIEPLEEQWMPHFMQLEVGEQVQPDDLLQACHSRQCQTPRLQHKID